MNKGKKIIPVSAMMSVAFIWFTTHFGGGFASGAQLYSYFGKYGGWFARWLPYCRLSLLQVF